MPKRYYSMYFAIGGFYVCRTCSRNFYDITEARKHAQMHEQKLGAVNTVKAFPYYDSLEEEYMVLCKLFNYREVMEILDHPDRRRAGQIRSS